MIHHFPSKESTSNKVSITEIPRANCFIESFASIKFKLATTLQLSSASAAAEQQHHHIILLPYTLPPLVIRPQQELNKINRQKMSAL